jgi:hypothetical protein
LVLFTCGRRSRALLRIRRVAREAVDLLVGSLAVQASRTVNANTMPVLEVHNLARGGSPGLLIRELVYDCGDPAVLLHCRALVVEFFFRAMEEVSGDIWLA